MTIIDELTNEVLEDYDLTKGHIVEKEVIVHHDEEPEKAEVFHYERIIDKNFKKIIDEPAQPPKDAYDEKVVEYYYRLYTPDELVENAKNEIRQLREEKCFPIINRGYAWYCLLSYEQLNELKSWYKKWLDAPDTGAMPEELSWVNEKLEETEDIL